MVLKAGKRGKIPGVRPGDGRRNPYSSETSNTNSHCSDSRREAAPMLSYMPILILIKSRESPSK